MAKINRKNWIHSWINIMKSYFLIISYAFFLRYMCMFLVIFNDFLIRRTKPRSKITHVIFIIYFHKFSILFKMSRVYCKEIMWYILWIQLHKFLNVPFDCDILINLIHFLLLTHILQNIMTRITQLITNCHPTRFVTPTALILCCK